MKQTLITLAAVLCCATTMMAEPVSPSTARQAAAKFLLEKGAVLKNEAMRAKSRAMGQAADGEEVAQASPYYVFYAANDKGFVVVSGDDCVGDNLVLGYTDQGSFNADVIPANLEWWLDETAAQIVELSRRGEKARKVALHADVPYLVTALWNQGDNFYNPQNPYNALCPESDGQLCVTGCMATALSQVLYYHRCPQEPISGDLPAYQLMNGNVIEALPPTAFDWDNMVDDYKQPTSEAQQMAVATLMRYCGQLIQMDYTPDISYGFAYDTDMLINQFGIDQGVFTANANNYSVSGWDELLYYELEEGRPLVFAGQSTGGGHAFVVDGYEVRDGNGYFHVNWGWGGSCNGYYKISLLNPDESGTGGSTTSDGYSFQQQAIIGLQPAKGATVNYGRYLYGFEWDITIDEQPHTLMGLNTSYKPAVFDVALAERQADGTADYSHLYGMQTLEVEGYSYVGLNSEAKTGLVKFTIPDGVADDLTPGSHQLVFVHKEAGTDAPWQPVYGPNSSVEFIIGDDGQPADTLFHPLPQLTSSSRTFKVEGLKQRGLCQKINAIVQNNGDDYIGTLTCSTYYVEGNELKGLAYLSNTGLMIEAGETTDVNFTVAPITTGQFVVVITRGQEDLTGIKLTDVKKAKNYINHKSFSIGELTFYCQSAAYNERTDEEGLPAYYLDLSVNNGTTLDYDAAIVANIYQGNYESVLFNGSPNVYAWLQVGAKSQQSVSIRLPEALEPDEYYVQLLIANDFYSLMHKDYFVFASGFITVTSKAGIGTIDEGLDTDGLSGNHEKAAIHDLFGRKVQNPQKGIYIRNGKKHLVR